MTEPERLTLRAGREDVPTLLYRPGGGAQDVASSASADTRTPDPAGVVLVTEAQGVNDFIRGVAADLASEGFVVAVPDYYHGRGPQDPEQLVDLAHLGELQTFIDGLDFRQGAEAAMVAVDHLASVEGVRRVAVWGYCTGGTLALMAACGHRYVGAAVLYYPSQPTFHHLSARHPQHPIDMIWQLRCPVLLVLGDDDPVWPAELRDEATERLARWSIPLELASYPGAGHAFASHFEDWHRPEATARSWARALAFLRAALPGTR